MVSIRPGLDEIVDDVGSEQFEIVHCGRPLSFAEFWRISGDDQVDNSSSGDNKSPPG